ncbi:uncharacterized transporter slc-17.2-like isoform X3 [Haliotis rufescens]|uniref:uncharacterized transporter slc-17.2-like isoform X3 n=1 Tax=Haliotis rufescens TaxID=6454 RepID=UPI00201EBC5C|nr:uncharacterized transporter slc-17.2-like isoform X3 [Haliotis rufescens]
MKLTCCIPWRYVVAGMWFIAFVLHDSFRSSLSITIVCMVNHDPLINITTLSYDINSSIDQVGIKQGRPMTINTTAPIMEDTCYSQERSKSSDISAVLYPSLPVFWARWAPAAEWNRMLGISLSGGLMGNAIIFPFGGYMCKYGPAGGWPSLYYVLGGAGFLWCLAWGLTVRDTPRATTLITNKERDYIELNIKLRNISIRKPPTPWLEMMTSRATIALITTHTLINYGVYMLMTQLPTYMEEVMMFDIKSNGIYSMLPYLVFWGVVMLTSWVSDCLVSRRLLSVGATRKLLNTLGCMLPAVSMLVLAMANCLPLPVAIALLCGAVGLVGFAFGGYLVNYADIALQFSGTLSGLGNCISSSAGIIAPYIVASMTVNGTRQEWQYAFFTGFGSFSLAALIFLCFGSGETQPWAKHDSITKEIRAASDTTLPDKDTDTEQSCA